MDVSTPSLLWGGLPWLKCQPPLLQGDLSIDAELAFVAS
jgi:hypothetical protein